jgi:hypothetical protein
MTKINLNPKVRRIHHLKVIVNLIAAAGHLAVVMAHQMIVKIQEIKDKRKKPDKIKKIRKNKKNKIRKKLIKNKEINQKITTAEKKMKN